MRRTSRSLHEQLMLAAETDPAAVLTHIDQVRPRLIVVDSIQTIAAGEATAHPAGGYRFVRSQVSSSGPPNSEASQRFLSAT